jgi:hypothetical protein
MNMVVIQPEAKVERSNSLERADSDRLLSATNFFLPARQRNE